ncbi:adhesion G-protein coupled receptor G5 [Brachyhypopomus gauderio]|uniref:adhesion G-protein coupled receptor G5 n=1 Tax=Brachyhypopomus gauderio TaxID=698409 RepID=UPI0040421600
MFVQSDPFRLHCVHAHALAENAIQEVSRFVRKPQTSTSKRKSKDVSRRVSYLMPGQQRHSKTMRRNCIAFFLIMQAVTSMSSQPCSRVLDKCELDTDIPRCLEHGMRNCVNKGRVRKPNPNLQLMTVNSSFAARVDTQYGHVIRIPSEALLRSITMQPDINSYDVNVKVFVLNASLFEVSAASAHENEVIKNHKVLGVWLGEKSVQNLSHPVTMAFASSNQSENGRCVYWKGNWSTEGCNTTRNSTHFVCSCNHLSFFAVLINPGIVIDPEDVRRLQYITYIGSSFSVVFTVIIIVLFLIPRKWKREHSVIIHTELAGSLLLLHLFFLASALFSGTETVACRFLGVMLHWALLAAFTWMAIEGFHLYLLLVRVFNIYIRRYLLKLSLVGWGIPSIVVMVSGVFGKYGRYTIAGNDGSDTAICWVTSKYVSIITINGYLVLLLVFNTTILAVMVQKLHQFRVQSIQSGIKVKRIWKDWATVLGLSWVLGLPWGVAFSTYGPLGLIGTYIFTTLNAFQGFLVFLWFLSITCHSKREEQQSVKGTSMSYMSSS